MSEDELLERIKGKLERDLGPSNVHAPSGSSEHGIDLIYINVGQHGESIVVGLQLKSEKTISATSVQKAIGQATVALGHEFTVGDRFKKPLDLVYIINYGSFNQQAREYLQDARNTLKCLIWIDKNSIEPYLVDTTLDINELTFEAPNE